MPTLNLPDVCTESPSFGKAFCPSHCELLQKKAPTVPTGLREFLKYSGALKQGIVYVRQYLHAIIMTVALSTLLIFRLW